MPAIARPASLPLPQGTTSFSKCLSLEIAHDVTKGNGQHDEGQDAFDHAGGGSSLESGATVHTKGAAKS